MVTGLIIFTCPNKYHSWREPFNISNLHKRKFVPFLNLATDLEEPSYRQIQALMIQATSNHHSKNYWNHRTKKLYFCQFENILPRTNHQLMSELFDFYDSKKYLTSSTLTVFGQLDRWCSFVILQVCLLFWKKRYKVECLEGRDRIILKLFHVVYYASIFGSGRNVILLKN